MQNTQNENAQRWRAWRLACESGRDRAEAYDRYLHPRSRVAVECITAEYGWDQHVLTPVGISA